jgi:hypothetical protein
VGTSSSRPSRAVANAPALRRSEGSCRCRERHRILRPRRVAAFRRGCTVPARVGLRDWFLIHAVAPVVPRGDARWRHFQRVCCASEGSSLARRRCPPCVRHQGARSSRDALAEHLRSAVVSPGMPYGGAAVSTVRPSLRAEAIDTRRRHRAVIKRVGVTGGRS